MVRKEIRKLIRWTRTIIRGSFAGLIFQRLQWLQKMMILKVKPARSIFRQFEERHITLLSMVQKQVRGVAQISLAYSDKSSDSSSIRRTTATGRNTENFDLSKLSALDSYTNPSFEWSSPSAGIVPSPHGGSSIPETTVKVFRKRMMGKLNCSRRTHQRIFQS